LAALARDRKPQEDETDEDKQGLKDEVHLCVGQMMKAEDPMDPDDIDAEYEAITREHAPEERRGGRSHAPNEKPIEHRDRGC
jgi:hypothetical protein